MSARGSQIAVKRRTVSKKKQTRHAVGSRKAMSGKQRPKTRLYSANRHKPRKAPKGASAQPVSSVESVSEDRTTGPAVAPPQDSPPRRPCWLEGDQEAYRCFAERCARFEQLLYPGLGIGPDPDEVQNALLKLRRTLIRIQVIRNAFRNSKSPVVSTVGNGIEAVLNVSRNSAYQWIHQLGLSPKHFMEGDSPLEFLIRKSSVIQDTLKFLEEQEQSPNHQSTQEAVAVH